MAITKNDIIQFITNLGETEAVELCFDALNSRRTKHQFENGDFEIDDVFCIAQCSFGSFEGEVDKRATIELYAKSYRENISPPSTKYGLNQMGKCEFCKVELMSYDKWVICPVCETKNELT